ncbi:MAG: glycosyltransferase family 39 protein [Nitrospirales bacterium]|nr:glycosyltransferase family 39 protein [Nitrospirales bacterium]
MDFPTLNYEPRYAKPAFVYWLISGSYALFGINEFAARLPSALSGLCLLLLQFVFVRRWAGPMVALYASCMLLLNLEFLGINRMVLTDPELVVFTTLAGYSFWHALHHEQAKRWLFAVFYLAMGCGMLVKGPVGIIIPLVGVIPYLTLTRQWGTFWQRGFPLIGFLLVAVVAAPWYVMMFHIHGDAYWAAAQANTTRQVHESHGRSWGYAALLCAGLVDWIFPMECLSPFCVLSRAQTMEVVLAGTRPGHAGAIFGMFPEPVGGGVVAVLYPLGHAPAPLHLSSVSGGSPAGRTLVEALFDRGNAGWTHRFDSYPHRGGIPPGHRDDVCAGGLSIVHEANC